MEFSEKKYIIFAGVNGSGKSTLYNLHPEYKNMPRVNVDEIVKKYGSWDNVSAQLRAGKEVIRLLNQYLGEEKSFNQETTLCGRSIVKNIEKARAAGFYIEMHYIGVESVDICKERIRHRVKNGGHGIPDEDVERRYVESLQKIKSMLDMCNVISFYDNTSEFTLIATYKNGKMNLYSQHIPEWFRKNLLSVEANL